MFWWVLCYLVYKIVSKQDSVNVIFMKMKNEVEKWLKRTLEDPLTKILAERSHLTKTQLETLLIDVLVEEMAGKDVGYELKSKMRPPQGGVSRGAFNRTLSQARRNVIRSMYTILLLGYVGILETTRLSSYLEMSNRLESYMEAYQKLWKDSEEGVTDEESLMLIAKMREELKSSLEELSRPKALSKKEPSS